MVQSVAGTLEEGKLTEQRPHHATSAAARVGGGLQARPGEVSLAHKGVLFLDELPEFSRPVLESLRQPLESRQVTVAGANHYVTYPFRFQLIAAMNPCKCDYQGRISGPLFDLIDLHIDVPALARRK